MIQFLLITLQMLQKVLEKLFQVKIHRQQLNIFLLLRIMDCLIRITVNFNLL